MQRAQQFLKWLYPGLRVKRWIGAALGGAMLFGVGVFSALQQDTLFARLVGAAIGGLGLAVMVAGMMRLVHSVVEVVSSLPPEELVDAVVQRRRLDRGPRIVALGGGTGLPALLEGLKAHTSHITAIVTAADDGGSSGRLREEFGIVPPGDLRNCLVALADDAEPLMRELFQYRFQNGAGLDGHSMGNLCVTALTHITGDFAHAVEAGNRVMGVRGLVVPSTYDTVQLVAEHDDGSRTRGESKIAAALRPIRRLRLEPSAPLASVKAVEAIRAADLIILGPGSLFTSVLPNLLVPGLLNAILRAPALKVYVCNLMTQFHETAEFSASRHVQALIDQTDPRILDWVVVNTGAPPAALAARYRREHAAPVAADVAAIRALGCRVLAENLMSRGTAVVRHDPRRLARAVLSLRQGGKICR